MNTLTHYLVAALVAILVGASWLLDGPDDTQTAQAVAAEADYAATLADGGRAKCAELGRVPRWTTDGDLVCRMPGVKEAKL